MQNHTVRGKTKFICKVLLCPEWELNRWIFTHIVRQAITRLPLSHGHTRQSAHTHTHTPAFESHVWQIYNFTGRRNWILTSRWEHVWGVYVKWDALCFASGSGFIQARRTIKKSLLVPAPRFKYTQARSRPSDTRISQLLVEALLDQRWDPAPESGERPSTWTHNAPRRRSDARLEPALEEHHFI